ncbi:FAD-dependent oxidoreductase [Rhabdobacter roseus]|uniref:D-amino-acid dehydrogenase n=1 Tax=Rhabdobacter roseus TaxID=1655419 RepID=A0A840TV33_9BACT|nr:FAD-dependent oxidoreductase [Rhabdobacter roseus]MBB5283820.1 D-amino-acid dehydrogenase [Rhabdobacter roseus]
MKHVGIVGGGISGLFSAYYLHKAGCEVTVIERGTFEDGCSFGNAGMIVPSHIVPLAQPGMISKGLRWMLSASSPFYVKPRLNLGLLKWGYLFWKHSTEAHVQRAVPILRDISLLSKQLFQEMAMQGELDFGWQEKGLFMLFKEAEARHELTQEAALANRAGIETHLLSEAEVQALEPELRVTVEGALYYPGDAHINPAKLIQELLTYLRRQGVTILSGQAVRDFGVSHGKIESVVTDGGSYAFDEVVVALGAWSPVMTEKLGITLPLQGGKGYSFTQRKVPQNVTVPAIMLEARATATPMSADLRFAGTLEVVGTDLSVNMNRVRGIVQSINRYYPDLPVAAPAPEEVWRGLRPCSPDGLPYLGRVEGFKNLTLATGHGMMGISLGAGTGKLISELLTGTPTSMDVTPFNPRRFG